MDVWYANLNEILNDRIIYDVLSPDEILEGERFQMQHLRDRYYYTKYITRLLAGRYLNEPAHSIKMLKTAEGKPYLGDSNILHFNASHSSNMFVVTFSDSPVGIDVEFVRPLPDLDSVALDICSETEYNYFNHLPGQDQLRYFFKLWSVKESFLKLTGSGLLKDPRGITIVDHHNFLDNGIVKVMSEGVEAYCTSVDFEEGDFYCFVCSQREGIQVRLRGVVQENILG